MIISKTDRFRSQEVTAATTVPKPIPLVITVRLTSDESEKL